jgi:phosphomannomutase
VKPIKFGTDGWRGIISFDFTFPRAIIVAEAVRRYLAETGFSDKPVLIGYDNRFLAQEFAANTASYLQSVGQPVSVFSTAVPTPVCAFGVLKRKAAGAFMFTASHNPYYYLGIKFIPHFAGPAEAETTERITAIIRDIETSSFNPPSLVTSWKGETINVREEYYAHLDTIVNAPALRNIHGKLLFAAFHGVGGGWVDDYLRRKGVNVETKFAERDVLFGGTLPDPSPSNLSPLRETVISGGYSLAFATDGDADRFGLMTPDGAYFGCNQVLPLLAEFLLTTKGKKGALVRTVATSHLVDKVAKAHQVQLIETPVGFKYVGRAIRDGALVGGEESGGLSVAGHVPEKDAILSIILLLDLLATEGTTLTDEWKGFGSKFGHTVFERLDLELAGDSKDNLIADVKAKLAAEAFLGRRITKTITIDGSKFMFEDGSWILFRPSGTEAVVRVYTESPDPHSFADLRKATVAYLHEYTAKD